MADIGDKSQELDAHFLSVALRNRQHAATVATPAAPIGHCLLCESAVEPPRRWCNAECRDLWEAENK